MKTSLLLFSLSVSGLHGECINCIKLHQEHQPDGKVIEWIHKKCMAIQSDIEQETCPGCGCPREKHSEQRDPYRYHQGKPLTSQNLGTVDIGTLWSKK